jgi:uncharacterized membrane protein YedE/YeeE
MENFTPLSSLVGGILVGLSATALLATHGRIAGISGIVGGLLTSLFPGGGRSDIAWRAAFIAGLASGGALLASLAPELFAMALERSGVALAGAGFLVGFGSRMGNGCTSGHGVCGVARGSKRSIIATATFMTTGALTALAITRFLGGRV